MLVDVVELRREGVPLPRETVLAARPRRGLLIVTARDRMHQRYQIKARLMAILADPAGPGKDSVLEPLEDARVVSISERGMLIYGMQQMRSHRRHAPSHPQAWWARVVGAAGPV